MRKCLVGLLCLSLLAANGVAASAQRNRGGARASRTRLAVAVTSESRSDRPSETVELNWSDLTARLPSLKPGHVLVTDHATGRPVVSQTIDIDSDGRPEWLVFQTDFAARERNKTFTVEASPSPVPAGEPKTFARFVPERHDDFAWENDRVAFRTYGPALETANPGALVSSGIDVWTKRTRNLVIDKWYKMGEAWYHKDQGEGLDMYSVRQSRGCGGAGVWDGRKLHVSRNYKSWRVLANGPVRTVFELTYDPWDAGGVRVSEVKRVTLDAGHNLNRVESTLKFDGARPVQFAVGVARHNNWKTEVDRSKENGWLSLWENTGETGSLGCAVAADPARLVGFAEEEVNKDDFNHLLVTTANSGVPVRYYTGAGWDRSGDFADRKAWNAYLDSYTKRLRFPLKITYLKSVPESRAAVRSWARQVADTVLATYPDPATLNQPPRWHYDNGFFLAGLLELWRRDQEPRYLQYVKGWVDLYVDNEGGFRDKAINWEEHELDDILPGRVLISLYQITKDEKYRKAARRLTEQLAKQPRTSEGGYWHKHVYTRQMWLDGIYMAGPYSVEYAANFNEPALYDEAVKQITLIHRNTHDPKTGLLYHGWEETKTLPWANPQTGASPEFWGRAIGWYMMALVDELDYLPQSHPGRGELVTILQNLSASLLKYQDARTGFWYQVVDKPTRAGNWPESSATSMYAYAFAKGFRKGYLGPQYAAAARKAYKGLLDRSVYLDDAGRVYFADTVYVGTLNPKVSKGDYDYYVTTARQTDDLKGVAAFLWTSLEMEKLNAR